MSGPANLSQSEASPKAVGGMPPDPITAYYQGAYNECRKLLTSPRFNRPQREVIEAEAWRIKAELEERGIHFKEASMTGRLMGVGQRGVSSSWRRWVAANTGRWIERLITAGFTALLFLLGATLVGCLILMFVFVWGSVFA